jgi:NADH-quinone oxidoreductase subunit A
VNYIFVLGFMGLAVLVVLGGLLGSRLLSPRLPGGIKDDPYECGTETIGTSWVQFNVGYYLFGLLFLIFDVEAAFLFPWAVVFREVGLVAFLEVGLFVAILLLGLLYAWKRGALKWV